MGHYRAEMMCKDCGEVRCTCPLPRDETRLQWLVDTDFSVIQAFAYQQKHNQQGLGFFRRMTLAHYPTQEAAQAAARVALVARISETRNTLDSLEQTLAAMDARVLP